MATFIEILDYAKNKSGIDGWAAYEVESINGGLLVTGGVTDGVYSRGKNKGKPRLNKIIKGTKSKIIISIDELAKIGGEK